MRKSAKQFSVSEAKAHFSRLINRALKGEEIVISRSGIPIAKLVAIQEFKFKGPRKSGQDRGKVWIADDFDAPLDPETFR